MHVRIYPAGLRNRGSAAIRRVEHATADAATLCGLPLRAVEIYRHPFRPGGPQSCAECSAAHEAAAMDEPPKHSR